MYPLKPKAALAARLMAQIASLSVSIYDQLFKQYTLVNINILSFSQGNDLFDQIHFCLDNI